MIQKNTGGSAFPRPVPSGHYVGGFGGGAGVGVSPVSGMTLRDYFAGQALAGFCSNQNWLENAKSKAASNPLGDIVSAAAYAVADAMIEARDK